MVALVEHDKTERRAQVLHVDVSGVVRRDGDGQHRVLAAAQDADVAAETCPEDVVPLRHQVQRGRHDQRVAAGGVDRQQRDVGLARPCGQDD